MLVVVVVCKTSTQGKMAEAEANKPRIVAVRGLNDIHQKRTDMPKAMVGMLQGLQYGIPTFAFHSLSKCDPVLLAELLLKLHA